MRFPAALPQMLLASLLLAGCAGPWFVRESAPRGDLEFARLSRLARVAYDKGSLAQAETLYRAAQRRARELDDAAGIGDSAYNLAAVLIARDRATEAGPLLDEAAAELHRSGQSPVDVWLVKARLAVEAGRSAEALPWLDAADSSAKASPAQRTQVALLRGEVAYEAGDVAALRAQLKSAKQLATRPNDFVSAGIEQLSGRVALLEKRPAEAAAAFDREAASLRRAGLSWGMAQALARAGEAFAQAGDIRPGAERFYRAARSVLAQGYTAAAKPLITRGEELARKIGDAMLEAQLRRLTTEAAAGAR